MTFEQIFFYSGGGGTIKGHKITFDQFCRRNICTEYKNVEIFYNIENRHALIIIKLNFHS